MLSELLEIFAFALVSISGSQAVSDLIIQILNPLYVLLIQIGL